MVKDYHMHPSVLTKPEQFSAYVNTALERGVQEICITDHMPYGGWKGDRIPEGRLKDYCAEVRRLAKQYGDVLPIRLGIEIDYHPSIRDYIEAVLKDGDFDFVVGAAHLHIIPENSFDSLKTYTDFARAMLEDSMLAAQSGLFDTIAHLDFFQWHFTLPNRFPLSEDGFVYEACAPLVERVLDAVRETGVRLEMNSHWVNTTEDGDLDRRMWPQPWVTDMALKKGLRFSYGSDAHKPHNVGRYLDELRKHPIYGRALADWERD